MKGENRLLVTSEPVEFHKHPISGKLPKIIEKFRICFKFEYVQSKYVNMLVAGFGNCSVSIDYALNSSHTYDRREPAVSLSNTRLKFKTAGKLPTTLEEFIGYTPI